MDQNSLLNERIENQQNQGHNVDLREINANKNTINRNFPPEFSHLITSVNQLAVHNSELLKMASMPRTSTETDYIILTYACLAMIFVTRSKRP